MSGKRFKFADGYSLRYNCIIDNLKGEDNDIHNVLKTDEVLNMLNKLHEENITLKSELSFSQNQNRELRKVLKDNRSMAEVVEENKGLKLEKHELEISLLNNKLAYKDLDEENVNLKGELDYWKKRALLLENKYNERDSIKWLRENTVWEQMPTNIKTSSTTHLSDETK